MNLVETLTRQMYESFDKLRGVPNNAIGPFTILSVFFTETGTASIDIPEYDVGYADSTKIFEKCVLHHIPWCINAKKPMSRLTYDLYMLLFPERPTNFHMKFGTLFHQLPFLATKDIMHEGRLNRDLLPTRF